MTSRMGRLASAVAPIRDEPKPASRLLRLSLLAAIAGLLWLAAALLYSASRPGFGPATLLLPGQAPRLLVYPFHLQNMAPARFTLLQQLDLPRLHPETFLFYPQDFLWALSVNGHEVRAPGMPLAAASHEGRSINLAPFLHPGVNVLTLQMEVRWHEGAFRLGVSPWDGVSLVLLAMVLGATFVTAGFSSTFFGADLLRPGPLICLAGIALRYIYVAGTPYYIRSFDYWGHAEYLDYVVQHSRLPPPDANWEAFQPPLYYLLVGGLAKILLWLGMAADQRFVLWQGLSLVFSIGVLAVGCVIARLLYEDGDRRRFYMLAVLAVAPPLVFNAARIGNDGLVALLSYAWLALLLSYWRQPNRARLGWLALVLGLALLTKASAFSLLVVTTVCLLVDRRFNLQSRFISLALLVALCGAISGAYYLPRALYVREVDTYIVGNLHSLSYRAHIDHVLVKSLVFNPFKVVRYPFDETWGPRNDHMLEVFFKTMLLGEWINGAAYKSLARWMVLVALLLVPLFVFGLWRAWKRKFLVERPLVSTLAGVFLAQWLFLQCAPYLSTQDFRYSVILLVPMIYFTVHGIYTSSYIVRIVATFFLQVAILNSAIYLLVLAS